MSKDDILSHTELLFEIKQLKKTYKIGDQEVYALRGLDLMISEGEFTTILGPSGCGKSTLLNIIGGIDRATSGEILMNDVDIAQYIEKKLSKYRRYDLGWIFQFYNLLPTLTATENVALSLQLVGLPNAKKRARKWISEVGLKGHEDKFPSQLSGGQQQRVASSDVKIIRN